MLTTNRSPQLFISASMLALAASVLVSCSRKPDGRDSDGLNGNIIVFSLYGVRRDALGAYSQPGTFTPVMDDLATANSNTCVTISSLAEFPALYKKAGCPAAAFTAVNGKNRIPEFSADISGSFSVFDEPATNYLHSFDDSARIPRGLMRHKAFPGDPSDGFRRGEDTVSAAIRWLSGEYGIDNNDGGAAIDGVRNEKGKSGFVARKKTINADKPFFILIEFADIMFRDSRDRTRFQGGKIRDSYSAEVAYIDLQIGRMLSFLSSSGLKDSTSVIITGNGSSLAGRYAGEDFAVIPDEIQTVTNLMISAAAESVISCGNQTNKICNTVSSVFPGAPLSVCGQPPDPALVAQNGIYRRIGLDAFNPDSAAYSKWNDKERDDYAKLYYDVSNRMRNPSTNDVLLAKDVEALVKKHPKSAQLHVWRGVVHSVFHETKDAIREYVKADKLSPGTPYILSNLGLSLLESGDIPAGIDKTEDAYLADPSNAEYRDNLATVLMNTGIALAQNKVFNEAVACMTRVIYLQPENPFAYVNMGGVYQAMERNDLAESSYRQALKLRPKFGPAARALEALKNKPAAKGTDKTE